MPPHLPFKKLKLEKVNSQQAAFLQLKRNKSCGHDNISVNAVKDILNEMKQPLVYIFNLIFLEGIYGKEVKIATITSHSPQALHPLYGLPPSPRIFTWTSWSPLHFYDFWGFTLCKHYWICNNWAVDALLNEFSIQKNALGIFIDLSKMFNTVSILLIIKSYLLLPFKIPHVVFLRGPFRVLYYFCYI